MCGGDRLNDWEVATHCRNRYALVASSLLIPANPGEVGFAPFSPFFRILRLIPASVKRISSSFRQLLPHRFPSDRWIECLPNRLQSHPGFAHFHHLIPAPKIDTAADRPAAYFRIHSILLSTVRRGGFEIARVHQAAIGGVGSLGSVAHLAQATARSIALPSGMPRSRLRNARLCAMTMRCSGMLTRALRTSSTAIFS